MPNVDELESAETDRAIDVQETRRASGSVSLDKGSLRFVARKDQRRTMGSARSDDQPSGVVPVGNSAVVTIGASGRIVILSRVFLTVASAAAHGGLLAFPADAGGRDWNPDTISQLEPITVRWPPIAVDASAGIIHSIAIPLPGRRMAWLRLRVRGGNPGYRWAAEGIRLFATPPIVNMLVLRSPDIHRAARFYQALGLLFTLERHATGPEHYASSVNGFVFEVYPLVQGRTPTTGVRLGFSVDSVDKLVPSLRALGAEVISEPHDSDWGRRAIVRDLDGHTVELVTPTGRDAEPVAAPDTVRDVGSGSS